MTRGFRLVALIPIWQAARASDEQPLKGSVIVVDPGHGGQTYSKSYTGGTRGVVSRMTESELNLKVAVKAVVGDDATFTFKAEIAGVRVRLTGEVSDRRELIDLMVAMRLFGIANDLRLPKANK